MERIVSVSPLPLPFSFFVSRSIFCTAKTENPVPHSSTLPRNGTEALTTEATAGIRLQINTALSCLN